MSNTVKKTKKPGKQTRKVDFSVCMSYQGNLREKARLSVERNNRSQLCSRKSTFFAHLLALNRVLFLCGGTVSKKVLCLSGVTPAAEPCMWV